VTAPLHVDMPTTCMRRIPADLMLHRISVR